MGLSGNCCRRESNILVNDLLGHAWKNLSGIGSNPIKNPVPCKLSLFDIKVFF